MTGLFIEVVAVIVMAIKVVATVVLAVSQNQQFKVTGDYSLQRPYVISIKFTLMIQLILHTMPVHLTFHQLLYLTK